MLTRGFATLAAALMVAAPAFAQPGKSTIFDVAKERAQRAIVTASDTLPELDSNLPVMGLNLSGAITELKGPKLDQLRATVPSNPMLGDAGNAERLCTIHLFARAGSSPKRVAIFRDKKAEFIAVELDSEKPERCQLKRDAFAATYFEWPNYRGVYEPELVKEPLGQVFEFAAPFTAGRFVMDAKTVGERFLSGGTSKLEADRVLDDEKFSVRLPRRYSPRNPAGLLVWISPMNTGVTPQCFIAALDDLNIICIGAHESGNNRQVTNRYQLAFDALACASQRFHVDPKRVYVTGMSGGGRVSSMLQMCFPDIFTGAVPIVGLSCYENVPSGTGPMVWPAAFSKPKPEMFNLSKTRRLAPITGRKDFNEVEMQRATAILKRDGMHIKLLDDAKLGHEMPTTEQFLECLTWVDEPNVVKRDAEKVAAEKAMEPYTAKYGAAAVKDEQGRRLLYKVMEAGPWTTPAWQAAERLGLVKHEGEGK